METTKKKWLVYGSIAFGVLLLVGFLLWLIFRNGSPKNAPKSLPLADAEQEEYIGILHERAKDTFRTFIRRVEKETGWKVLITSGYRTFEKQAELHAANSKNAKPGSSYHNYGMAIDINLIKADSRLKMASPKSEWMATGVPLIAADMDLEWGGNYNNYHDPVHFQLNRTKYPMKMLQEKGREQFGNDPKKIRGNQVKL